MKKLIYVIVTAIMIFATLIGCSFQTVDNSRNTEKPTESTVNDNDNTKEEPKKDMVTMTLYFANRDNSAIPKEYRDVEVKDSEIVEAAIEALLAGPKSNDLQQTIPEGTKLLKYEIKGDLAIVDFSKEYNTANDIAEIVERISLVNTLTSLDGIKKVKILVEGKDLIGPSGEPFGELTKAALDEQGRPIPGQLEKVTIYFANGNADALVPEQRDVVVNNEDSKEKIIMEELIKGPGTAGLSRTIPEGTKLLAVETVNGTCTVNMSREIIENHPGGSAGEIMTLDSIVNSLTELKNIQGVQLLIEGEKREAFIHLEIGSPMERDESIIQK